MSAVFPPLLPPNNKMKLTGCTLIVLITIFVCAAGDLKDTLAPELDFYEVVPTFTQERDTSQEFSPAQRSNPCFKNINGKTSVMCMAVTAHIVKDPHGLGRERARLSACQAHFGRHCPTACSHKACWGDGAQLESNLDEDEDMEEGEDKAFPDVSNTSPDKGEVKNQPEFQTTTADKGEELNHLDSLELDEQPATPAKAQQNQRLVDWVATKAKHLFQLRV